jgi:prolipoprotein diacylglyceryltransferase
MFDGALASLYLAGYGLASFVAGYFRAPEETTYVMERSDRSAPAILDSLLVLADHQVVAASVLLLGVGLLVWFRVRHQPEATIKTYTE